MYVCAWTVEGKKPLPGTRSWTLPAYLPMRFAIAAIKYIKEAGKCLPEEERKDTRCSQFSRGPAPPEGITAVSEVGKA